ncbi:bifunctional 4-hydroxy-2-oxoglutarate aldolase/2-dehydro-3-deoxy-phosphogluconate aldolase [Hyphococcus flavus]|uniref:Bifunctional 4-hydroxy-2-oxoglutarate aldolase/2-dehydro-3-deoxy-phosphogluconate aldolase n=1 Tax=Hyphococcus flavus TaxID=1866326 RepID=A0AAF0CFY3_9PROT|nr:bifunctional 4-hydroxy-2-oxoglutarate aldolase/2-dehydro-3-deoxy-phosphogluconate aldolase [Hyphococcus flavus]WDI30087.1 bifunctional 4-hydroxy-2-oxoglutarate aldolase/2-dehydro-3-deoxy-phosphogluconate aldolase [Hyphococcus flavus]
MLAEKLNNTPVVPLVQADDPEVALKTVAALQAGGLDIIEVVLRTDAALSCLEAIAKEASGAIVGAGTVLSESQAKEAVKHGAKFIVSPGLNDDVVKFCQAHKLEVFPGVVTPSEVQRAWNLGLRTVKFFPAGLSGGAPMLKALSSVFRGMKFMPTGGVSTDNLKDFLAIPSVIACGGSWLTPAKEIEAGNFGAVTELASEAVKLAAEVRK